MHYDSLTSGDESSPTTEDLHGDAAVPVGGCHEAPGEEMSQHFGWGEAPTDEQMEADYAARRCEAELARRCVATGEPQQAAVQPCRDPAPVRVIPTAAGRFVGVVSAGGWTGRTLPQRSADLARRYGEDLYVALGGPGRAA